MHGTVVVLEAIKARLNRIRGLAYAKLDGRLQRLRSVPRPRVGRNRARKAVRRVQARKRGDGTRVRVDDDVASIGSARTSSTGQGVIKA